jgi:hypothetical protein
MCVCPAIAQQPTAGIRIKLINGMNGKPMKTTQVGLEIFPGYHEYSVQTNEIGVATVNVRRDSVILTHNTRQYVACADDAGGRIHNDFKVAQILSTGMIQPVPRPTRCHVTTTVPIPGELVVFVRPWGFLEQK